jgi:hypothetical protein
MINRIQIPADMASFSSRNSRSSRPGGGAPLLGWLGRDPNAATVLATAQRYLQVREALSAALPAPMRGAFEVLKIENGVLTLSVSSAAFAAKFRQLAPRMTAHLQGAGWNLTEIKLRVKGPMGFGEQPRPGKEARALDAHDLKSFEDLRAQLRPGPLADAVSRLLAHHRADSQEVRQASIPGEMPGALPPAKSK